MKPTFLTKSPAALTAALALGLVLSANPASGALLAHYSFDTDFTDGVGSNNLTTGAGTPIVTTTGAEVKFGGGALDLDGTEHLTVPGTTDFNFASNEAWSVSFWAKRRSTAGISTGMVMGDTSTKESFIWVNENASQGNGFRFRSVGNVNTDISTANGSAYHHWVLVSDGANNLTVYWDNTVHGTASGTNRTNFNINAIGHGYNATGFQFDGQLDEIYIFDEAISATQVNSLFTSNAIPEPSSLVLLGLGGVLLMVRRRRN